MTEEKRNDEIDLIEVFTNIYLFFKKHFWFLFGAVLVGAILGYSTKFYTQKFYESSMLIESEILREDILKEYIDNIQSLKEDKNYNFLSEKMDIEPNKLINLISIESEIIKDKNIHIKVKAHTNTILQKLAKGIANYINKEEYVQNEIDIFKKNTRDLINKINQEIKKIEQIQANFIEPQNRAGEIRIYSQEKSLQEELLLLTKEKQKLKKAIQLAAPFRVIKDFTIYNNPKTKATSYTLAGALIFGFIAFLILIVRNINRSLKEKGIS
ncbi:MAG: hypothetical protein U9P82_02470 [Bacteroidota bacterium]|nr:hypothetical protein [Bacteroidota bacterium]